jgi:response regulator of citrate/malate metabolism
LLARPAVIIAREDPGRWRFTPDCYVQQHAVGQVVAAVALEMVRAAVGRGALAYLLKPFTFAPKGAAPGTNDEIARAVRDSAGGITADEVAKQAGVSRVTAWRYLERLADEGTLTRQTDYGKAGRPKTRYTWR